MPSLTRDDVVSRLENASISDVIEDLKTGIRRDPYWGEGHRLLGDLYLTELEHDNYALVEYRKLEDVQEDPPAEDLFRLALGYHRRSFDEKTARVINRIERQNLPDQIRLIRQKIDTDDYLDELVDRSDDVKEDRKDEWFRNRRQEGIDYLKTGNLYQAQQEFERALDYRDDDDIRVKLAQCLLRRRRYPRAVSLLKDVLANQPEHELALSLLETAYDRLGLDDDVDASRKQLSDDETGRRWAG